MCSYIYTSTYTRLIDCNERLLNKSYQQYSGFQGVLVFKRTFIIGTGKTGVR